MIEELRIRGLGVIEEAVVPFAPGLTVLTGETGAGKTMVLTGLGLIMGGRADGGLVRAGAERADVDGAWRIQAGGAQDLVARLEEAGASVDADGDDIVVLLGRSVASGGRTRAFAGGRSVPATALADLTERLIAVHGQADQITLREPRRQRDLLDLFGGPGLLSARVAYAAVHTRWRAAEQELADLVEHRQEREREAVLLRHGIAEIAAVAPEPGEDEALKAQATVLSHATDLLEAVGHAHALVAGSEEASAPAMSDLVGQALRALDRARALDPGLAPIIEQLEALGSAAGVVAAELAEYARGADADPGRQAEVEERRQAISVLKRRYGPALDDVLAWWASAEVAVATADGADERIASLETECSVLRQDLVSAAALLSDARRIAAGDFAAAVTAELHGLAMPDAALTVQVETATDPADFTHDGADAVAMLLTPHAGSEPRPLGKGASGGELSRIMLAIEVVLAGANEVPTFVFDEVDAGIGGKVAVEVGRRLARLARAAQVIVVTHLPQVAAFADQHVVVSKDRSGQVTATSVTVAEGTDRVRELVRMLSGLEDSASGAEHAAELLALADADRGQR
jgi:DNA repair protein RecN (Recombination protein N)